MFKESILGKLFFALLSVLKTFEYSFLKQVLVKIGAGFSHSRVANAISGFFTKEDKIQVYCTKSGIIRFFDKILVSVISFFSKLYKKLRAVNKGSLNNSLYNYINKKSYFCYQNILAVLIVMMVCVPGNRWNNLYGLMIAAFSLFLYAVVLISGKNFSYRIAKFDFFMLLFMISSVLAVVVSHAVSDSIRVFMFFVTAFIFMIVVSGSLKNYESIDKFIGIINIGLILTSLYCIYQGITGVEIDVRLTDINANQGMPGRAYSTFENPNNYAEYLVMFMPFMAAFALNQKNKKQKILWICLLIVPMLALLYTYSRSCWVSVAIAAFIFICFYNYKLIPYLFLFALIAIPFLPESIMNRILTIGSMKDSSNSYRLLIWEGALKMLKDTFVTGIGLGPSAYSLLYPSYANPSAILAPHSHMLFMEVLVEMGIIGFISFITYWILTLKRLITIKAVYNLPQGMKNYICAAISSFTGIIFVCGVEYIWFYPRTMFCFFIMAGLTMAIINASKKERIK